MPELTRRYIVMSMAAEGPFDIRDPNGAFVLKPWKDPAAVKALEAYSRHCYPQLAMELVGVDRGDLFRAANSRRCRRAQRRAHVAPVGRACEAPGAAATG